MLTDEIATGAFWCWKGWKQRLRQEVVTISDIPAPFLSVAAVVLEFQSPAPSGPSAGSLGDELMLSGSRKILLTLPPTRVPLPT